MRDIRIVQKQPKFCQVGFARDEYFEHSIEIRNKTKKENLEQSFLEKSKLTPRAVWKRSAFFAFSFQRNLEATMSIWKDIHGRITVRMGWAVVMMVAMVFSNVFRADGSVEVTKLGDTETKPVATSGVSVISESPKISLSSQEGRIVELEERNLTLKNRVDKLSSQMKYYPVSNPEDQEQTDNISDLQNSMELLSGQVKALLEQNSGIIDFALAIDYKNLIYKNKAGNLDLEDGKLKAREILVQNLSIENDGKNKTIGQGAITPIKQDGNLDSFDDNTLGDGKSVKIETSSVEESSRIFLTPRTSLAFSGTLTVTEIHTGEYFKVSVSNLVSEDVTFDWMIVNENK